MIPVAELTVGAMNACYYMTGGCNPSVFNPETYLWGMPREIELHCRTVAVDAGARAMGIVRSWYPSIDMSLIEAAYCPEVPEDECMRLVADSMPVVEKLMAPIDVNPHHPPLQTYRGPVAQWQDSPAEEPSIEALEAGPSTSAPVADAGPTSGEPPAS